MVRLFLLLLGSEVVRRRWRLLAVLGAAWAGLGLFVMVDALDGRTVIRPHYFGYFLLFEGLLALAAATAVVSRRRARFAKAAILIVPGVIIVVQPPHSHLIIAIALGITLLLDGALRIASAYVVRFEGWRNSLAAGVVEVLLAIGTLEPWPTWYEATIGVNVGLLLLVSGWGTIRLALRLRRLPREAPISVMLGANFPAAAWRRQAADAAASGHELIVYIWTPVGSVRRVRRRRPIVDRYVAAVSRSGAISTGHAALELPPDLYISHYPAADLDLSPEEFRALLRAGPENDVPGRFLPSYAEEAAGWCEATEQVRFTHVDRERLRSFWREYRKDTTYNLTSRNCSSVVAAALDAALEGALGRSGKPWRASLRALLRPELWAAGVLRQRAEAMAWTPGLVLDYARLLQAVVEPLASAAPSQLARPGATL